MTHQPMQPIEFDERGVIRFKRNAIVDWLVRTQVNLNEVAIHCQKAGVPIEDQEQFWQLLGYSVSGYGDLSFVRPETVAKADAIAEKIMQRKS